MAEETQAAEAKDKAGTNSTVAVLGIVVMCLIAVFMINTMNKMKMELIKLNQQMETLVSTTAQNSMSGYQAVDEKGKVEMIFTPKPIDKLMEESDLLRDE